MRSIQSSGTIVVGAGLSGLAAAKELKKRGIPVIILEASAQIASPWRARHPRLRLNIHRYFARLPDSPVIRDKDTYLHKDSVVTYLSEYAAGLGVPIHFKTSVHAVWRDGNEWSIETNNGTFHAGNLIVATGRERLKTMPVWPGIDGFCGQVIHAADFADPTDYDGKKVLVVGAGNSGTDVLNHLSRSRPAHVWVSVRHGPSILPSRILGFPLQRLANIFSKFPKWSLDPMFAIIQRLFLGDLRRYGLRRHAKGGGSRMLHDGVTFALDDGFVAALKARRFEAVGETVGFSAHAVELANGDKIQPDVVICATGYTAGLDDVFGHLGALDSKGYPLHPAGTRDPNNLGLWFTGYGVTFQGFFHAAGKSAVRIAAQIAAQTSTTSSKPSLGILGNHTNATIKRVEE